MMEESQTDGSAGIEETLTEAYWDTISDEKLITGYLEPLEYNLYLEGFFVKAVAIRRTIERLRTLAE